MNSDNSVDIQVCGTLTLVSLILVILLHLVCPVISLVQPTATRLSNIEATERRNEQITKFEGLEEKQARKEETKARSKVSIQIDKVGSLSVITPQPSVLRS